MECEPHTDFPQGYMEASMTAGMLLRNGYAQRRCAGCKLFAVWYDKKTETFLQSYKDAQPLKNKINRLTK